MAFQFRTGTVECWRHQGVSPNVWRWVPLRSALLVPGLPQGAGAQHRRTPRTGCQADSSGKRASEMTLIGKPCGIGDVDEAECGIPHELASSLNATLNQPLVRRQPRADIEQANESASREPACLGNRVQSHSLGNVFAHQLHGATLLPGRESSPRHGYGAITDGVSRQQVGTKRQQNVVDEELLVFLGRMEGGQKALAQVVDDGILGKPAGTQLEFNGRGQAEGLRQASQSCDGHVEEQGVEWLGQPGHGFAPEIEYVRGARSNWVDRDWAAVEPELMPLDLHELQADQVGRLYGDWCTKAEVGLQVPQFRCRHVQILVQRRSHRGWILHAECRGESTSVGGFLHDAPCSRAWVPVGMRGSTIGVPPMAFQWSRWRYPGTCRIPSRHSAGGSGRSLRCAKRVDGPRTASSPSAHGRYMQPLSSTRH